LSAELVDLAQPRAALTALENAPGMPACTPPPVPAATYPPGASYGVPFLAAITNGQLLAGYDVWTSNNNRYTYGGTTYELYPWQTKIYNITGWVTGLIQLPNLNATISPEDIVFCDSGGAACLTASPPAAECIDIITQFPPTKSAPSPPPALTNVPFPGEDCAESSNSQQACIGYIVTLAAAGPSSLTVTGVEPDGALDLQVTTSALATGSLNTLTCTESNPTVVTLSTQAPTSLPAGSPPPPVKPNTDYRYLQTAVQPLTGPLATATSSVASDDFTVPAFLASSGGPSCGASLAESLDIYADGWGPSFSGKPRYKGHSAIAAFPGWGQFSATTTVVTLGFPIGPPPNFHL
jgi:hypothetical protein